MNVYQTVTDRIIHQLEGGSASYIRGWLSVLNDDNRFIVSASAKADKAVRMILGREAA